MTSRRHAHRPLTAMHYLAVAVLVVAWLLGLELVGAALLRAVFSVLGWAA